MKPGGENPSVCTGTSVVSHEQQLNWTALQTYDSHALYQKVSSNFYGIKRTASTGTFSFPTTMQTTRFLGEHLNPGEANPCVWRRHRVELARTAVTGR
jgi:hypothetical protein